MQPYGSWRSPITSERVAGASLRLSQPRLDGPAGEELYWLEGRPAEGGRQSVCCASAAGSVREVTPREANVRTRVHEYGGGEYVVRDGVLVYSDLADGRVYRLARAGGPARALSEPGAQHADFELSPDGRWVLAVEERPRSGGEPLNRIVALPLAAAGVSRVVADGHDFVSSPRFSPDGKRLAFTAWDHPQMPWDGTQLFELDWGDEGPAGSPRRIAGGPGEAICQPEYAPDGRLSFVSDRSGWWNLYQVRESGSVALCPREAEFGRPQWVFGISTYAFVDARSLLCVVHEQGRDRLARLDLETGGLRDLELPFSEIDGLRVRGGRACFVGASPSAGPAVYSFELAGGVLREHRSSLGEAVDSRFVAVPEPIVFEASDAGPVHAHLYRPTHPGCSAPAGERPPLLVKSHGGPTGAATTALDLRIQYWTSRGFAVLDVDYRGSSGFGRAYRERLRGAWGVADVEDCVAAARFAAEQGWVDPQRLAISGSSAGGYTTLCALTFHDAFRAGASYYGIGDLEALALDTHKFESRYLDGLVGPYPERRDLYRARSPVHFAERLSCPVIFFQGLEDRVVPPAQAEAMVAALAERGIPHAYVPFAGEQHGFRRAESIRAALDGEFHFYARVFGFEVDTRPGTGGAV